MVEAGLAKPDVPIVTTVHSLQLVEEPFELESHDISLDAIATPEGLIHCERAFQRPQGILWDLLQDEQLATIPLLQRLQARE